MCGFSSAPLFGLPSKCWRRGNKSGRCAFFIEVKHRIAHIAICLLSVAALAAPQDDRTAPRGASRANTAGRKPADPPKGSVQRFSVKQQPKAQPRGVVADEDVPDSLLHPRWPVRRTVAWTLEEADSSAIDLRTPENLKVGAEYDDSTNLYLVGTKMGEGYLSAPILMTPDEYMRYTERKARRQFFRQKDAENVKAQGKEKFDFSDMHFSLGPAEKIFGPGGVRVKTQGTAELKMGATLKSVDNPSLPERNRRTKAFDFDEKINLSVSGKVGDKVNMNLNYNTDATFDFDTKNLKLRYEGKEDEIVKLVEAGNVTFPSNNSLVHGASSLFGVRTDLQFGKLKLQTVFSQKKSSTSSVSAKGGTQTTPFELNVTDYEENRHFFLDTYFLSIYDRAMQTLPNMMTGVNITRMEVWTTNKTGTTQNTRSIVAFADMGETTSNTWGQGVAATPAPPHNAGNGLYATLVATVDSASRSIDLVSERLEGLTEMTGGVDYEKLQSARLLNPTEYSFNSALGTISLKTQLQTDQVLAVAYEYTYGGQTYQVGEFSTDVSDTRKCLFVKALKNTQNSPQQPNWRLMMKNVYYLASRVDKEKFKLDIKYQSDTTGAYLSYLPEADLKQTTLIKVMGADRLDKNMKPHANGQFDYVEGYTVSNGRVFLPVAEPFGKHLRRWLEGKGMGQVADKYVFEELYDSTKTVAKQISEKNKFILQGSYKGSNANVISLGAYNVPQGSVVVTAGGVTLQEGADYSVDYANGEVTILNQSIIDAGTNVNVSLESNTDYGMQRKTMLGLNWQYDFSKNFSLAGTVMHLSEQPLTTKVSMGTEPLKNTIWGLSVNWKKESQWLTNVLDRLPLLHLTQPSQIAFTGEFAQLIAGQASGTQDNASYIDDFENTKNLISVSEPSAWVLSSVPTMMAHHDDKTGLSSGYQRARLAWYYVDPIFTRHSSSLTPSHIKSDMEQLSNHYVREVYVKELYPNRDQSTYNGATSTLNVLNLAYYPAERGPYNFTTRLTPDGRLQDARGNWGGMMRRLETTDFEQANIEYVEFWLMDPFIYHRREGTTARHEGDLYINLGEVSEDILRDGMKAYESGLPVDGSENFKYTQWGKIPQQTTQTYAFATTSGSRALQDLGFNGLNDQEEAQHYGVWLDTLANAGIVTNDSVLNAWRQDPAGDNYHYFRGTDFDDSRTSILDRYKRINNPQGNSPDNDSETEGYDTSYKTGPDVEDINQDYTLNEYERYYQYRIHISDQVLQEYLNGNASTDSHITDVRRSPVRLRNGDTCTVNWYQFRIPLRQYTEKVGTISDFTSIRFMRMFLTGFEEETVLRFGSLDLVRGEWRQYKQSLLTQTGAETGSMEMSAVNIEENTDRKPVGYVLPPGISRATDPQQAQLVENNEQALCLVVRDLSENESKAVYKTTTLDLRRYKHLEMFVHANALLPNVTNLEDHQLAVFIRLGSDYKSNYYEYLIPLKLTPEGNYRYNVAADRPLVWPADNMLDIALDVFTRLKKARNKSRAAGVASFTQLFSDYDPDHPKNKVSIMGNPSLGEVKTMIIGVRNLSAQKKSGEVWVNELRLKEFDNKGGWAASGNLNVQLSDFGTLNLTGRYKTDGFGGLEESVMSRSMDTEKSYSVTTQLQLGKFFPDKAKVQLPLYYSYTKELTQPKYNPLDTDMELSDALDAAADKQERDSIKSIAIIKNISRNFSVSGARVDIKNKRFPLPIDPANFTFSYSHQHRYQSGETTVYSTEDEWRGSLDYSYSPVYKTWEPFKKLKGKSKWLQFPKAIGFNYLPQNVSFNTDMTRNYSELMERDLENTENPNLPLQFSEQFLWNREFSLRWDFTKNLHANFQSATHAEIEEPYTAVNKDLYPERYQAWKDSVKQSIFNLGRPLDYHQTFTASYKVPLNKLPILDWTNFDISYNATYNWVRGTELDDGTSLGNTIQNNRNLTVNGQLNLETLYNHVPFLKKVNDRFKKQPQKNQKNKKDQKRNTSQKKKDESKEEQEAKQKDDQGKAKEQKQLPKNKNTFSKEVVLLPDTTLTVQHGKKSRRLIVSAKTQEGKPYNIKWKVVDDNKIVIKPTGDSIKLKVNVTTKKPLEEMWWYDPAQYAARALMSVRSLSFSYRSQRAMTLPGFLPDVGDAFGQRTGSPMAPGLDFAFGLNGDGYVQKALDNGWLLSNESVATPSSSSSTEDLQLKATLEPVRDFKIDLNASRSWTQAKSVQFMYKGMPTTHSGTFNMTTISISSAFEGLGDANSGYRSKAFDRFLELIPQVRQQVQARYDAIPEAAKAAQQGRLSTVNPYGADVLVPAFLQAYTLGAGSSLDLFPALSRLLPNWTVRYSGLSKLSFFADRFKSVNLNHSYKSVFAVGSYASFSSWQEYMNGLGYVSAADGSSAPSSMYNVSTVSINESFAPLLGVDVTLQNNMTFKVEYRSTRVLNLSVTSVQVNQNSSKDWVIGWGWKINDFKLFSNKTNRKIKGAQNRSGKGAGNKNNSDNSKKGTTGTRSTVNHDLNLRFDLSIRDQASITRDIATGVSTASNGNKALKMSFSADYTLSRLLTVSAYYDRQTNKPLLSASSYPTTTRDFGLSLKFSLTR